MQNSGHEIDKQCMQNSGHEIDKQCEPKSIKTDDHRIMLKMWAELF